MNYLLAKFGVENQIRSMAVTPSKTANLETWKKGFGRLLSALIWRSRSPNFKVKSIQQCSSKVNVSYGTNRFLLWRIPSLWDRSKHFCTRIVPLGLGGIFDILQSSATLRPTFNGHKPFEISVGAQQLQSGIMSCYCHHRGYVPPLVFNNKGYPDLMKAIKPLFWQVILTHRRNLRSEILNIQSCYLSLCLL